MPKQKIKPWRGAPNFNVVHGIRVRINMANPDPAKGEVSVTPGQPFHIGTLPPGALVLPAFRHVSTGFNGTTPTVDVGTMAVPAAYAASAAIAPATPAAGDIAAAAATGYVADETPLYVTVGGTGVTAGVVDILIPFYFHKD